MKRFIINILERLRVKKSKRNDIDVALTVANSVTADASFSDNAEVDTKTQTPKDVNLSLPRSCMNCGEVLTGPYCFACGQKEGDIRRPIWSLLGELLDNVVAPDSKLFKTLLLLLFMPGKLTYDYNSGKRARFIPPLRLYITITFAFFALLLVADVLILDVRFTLKDENRDRPEQTEQTKPVPNNGPAKTNVQISDAETIGKAGNDFVDGFVDGWNSYEPDRDTSPSQSEANPAVPQVPQVNADQSLAENLLDPSPASVSETAVVQNDAGANPVEGELETPDLEAVIARLREKYGDDLRITSDKLTEAERAEFVAALDEQLKDLPIIARNAIKDTVLSDNLDVNLDDLIEDIADDRAVSVNPENIKINADGFPYDVSLDMFVKRTDEEREGIRDEELKEWISNTDTSEMTVQFVQGFAEAIKDPRKFNDVFNDWLPPTLFVMVPFFALILRLFHWGKKRFYFNQLIFSLHYHTFLFLIFIGFVFAIPITGSELALPIFWGLSSLYMIIALKYGQDQGWIRAFFKAGPIWVSYSFFLIVTLFLASAFGISGRSLGDLYNLISNGTV